MPNLNKVMLMGNLTRDPEIKYTPKGTAIANFGIAVNRTYTPEGGEKREEVTFIDLEAFGRTAEIIGEYFKKGRPIFIEGRLKLDQWDDKTTGKKMSKLRVVVDTFEFLGSREGGGGGGGEGGGSAPSGEARSAPPPRRAPSTPPRPPADPDLDVQADDVPF
ncbi:MAG: single-stranded DNA-binding protein [Chthoniobacteraceae bacterium]